MGQFQSSGGRQGSFKIAAQGLAGQETDEGPDALARL